MKIAWLKEAAEMLDRHYDYLRERNPAAAKRVFARILESTERLHDFPQSGRTGAVAGTWELIVPGLSYVIIYRITPSRIEILRVFHSSQNWRN